MGASSVAPAPVDARLHGCPEAVRPTIAYTKGRPCSPVPPAAIKDPAVPLPLPRKSSPRGETFIAIVSW